MKPAILQETDTGQFMPLFSSLPLPALLMKPNAPLFPMLAANAAYQELFETTDHEINGRSFFEFFGMQTGMEGSEQEARMAASLNLVLNHKQPHTVPELRVGRQERWSITHSPVLGDEGEVLYLLQTITLPANTPHPEQRTSAHAESPAGALPADTTAAYLQAMIDTSQTGIFLFTPVYDTDGQLVDFRFRLANHTLAAYIGKKPADVIGGLGSQLFPAFKTNGLFDYYSDTYLTGKANHFSFHYSGDGIDAWLDIMSTRLNDEVLVTFSDVTAQMQLQQKMESSMEALKRSNDNLEQFAYVASHDLQEPLRKIKSFGDMLVSRYKEQLGPEGADLIGRMQAASGRMKGLIEDLLTFSRISSFQENAFEPVDLNEVIREVLTDLEPSVKEKKAEIEVALLQPVTGDAVQMRQVFQNLLSNAIKFVKKGEPPRISIAASTVKGADAAGFMLAPDQRRQMYQQITVKDEGIGFEPEYAMRIFQIFQRLHGRMEYPGSGVGLSIVQKVVERHKGFIRAVGEPGKGATFILLLPVQ